MQEQPVSALNMLLHLDDLDISFLDSYNILRMAMIIPCFSMILTLMVVFRDQLEKKKFVFLSISTLFFIEFKLSFFSMSGISQSTIYRILIFCAAAYYFKNTLSRGRLEEISYIIILVFLCVSIFLYHADMAEHVYAQLYDYRIKDTYGFWGTWIFTGIMLPAILISCVKSIEHFIVAVIAILLSIHAYQALTTPFFHSELLRYMADNLGIICIRITDHLGIVFTATSIAIISGVPIGIFISRHQKIADIVLYAAGIMITIPSIALFGFMMPVLSSIDRAWDAVEGIGIGKVPAVIALALYSLLPIIRNTYIAIKNLDTATVEAGKGMGMTKTQLLLWLQLPLAAPVIMAGVRTSVVMGIAIAAIAAFIGAGGLGLFVAEGLQMATQHAVITGALSMSMIAVVADFFLGKIEKWITPKGIRVV